MPKYKVEMILVWSLSNISSMIVLANDTIELLPNPIPVEQESGAVLEQTQLVAIEGGRELLLYGGFTDHGDDDKKEYSNVWRFTFSSRKWTNTGNMLEPRSGHVVLPVNDITC